MEKNQGPNVDSKGIKAYFLLDESGVLTLSNVELLLEKTMTDEELAAQEESPLSKLGSTISKLFTGWLNYIFYCLLNIELFMFVFHIET